MKTKIQRWGNSYAVRLPKQVVVKLGFQQGTPVEVEADDKALTVRKATEKNTVTIKDWKKYLIPMKKGNKDNVSERIDEILYGKPRR